MLSRLQSGGISGPYACRDGNCHHGHYPSPTAYSAIWHNKEYGGTPAPERWLDLLNPQQFLKIFP